MNQQSSISQQSDNLLSLACSWFRNRKQPIVSSQNKSSIELQPPNRALYERVRQIADELSEEDSMFNR